MRSVDVIRSADTKGNSPFHRSSPDQPLPSDARAASVRKGTGGGQLEDELQTIREDARDDDREENDQARAKDAAVAGDEAEDGDRQPERRRAEAVPQVIEEEQDPLEEHGPDERAREPDEIDAHSAIRACDRGRGRSLPPASRRRASPS